MTRRSSILMLMAVAVGLVLCHQFDSRAALRRATSAKSRSMHAQDEHLIRQNEEAKRLREQVDAAKKAAFEHGYHACCINPPCSWCLLHLGQCMCAVGVGSNRYACRECHGGWEANQGRIPGKTKADVRKMKTITGDFANKEEGPPASAISPEQTGSPTAGSSPDGSTTLIAAGEKVYNSKNCQSCHKMNGQGGNGGPDLTHEAQRNAYTDWQIEHLKAPQKIHPGSTMPSYADMPADQLKSLAAFLISHK